MEEKELYLAGIAQMKSGNYVAAFDTFSKAISLYPKNADFYSERGVVRFHLNDLKGALIDMDKAQELEPDKPYRYSSRAFIKDALKDVHGAIEDYKIAIQLDPEDDIAHNNLGLLEEKIGFSKMAQVHASKADELASSNKIQRGSYDSFDLDSEGEMLIESIKKELNLDVIESPEVKPQKKANLFRTAMSVFTSKKALKDYLRFVRKGLFK